MVVAWFAKGKLYATPPMNFLPNTPITSIPRILPAYQKRLSKLGIKTLRDLFLHFPHRYQDLSAIKPIGELKLNEVATIQGKIVDIKNIRTWKKRIAITEAHIQDDSGLIKAVWFNQPYLANTLKENYLVSISGKVGLDKDIYLSNPAYERLTDQDLRHTGRLIPVYPETSGLTSRYLRYLIHLFRPTINQIAEWLPPTTIKAQKLLDLQTALRQIHFPDSTKTLAQAKRRLAFNELFLIQLFALQQKIKWQKSRSPQIVFRQNLIKNFVDQLPFKLTDAQRRSAWEIFQDMQQPRPMNRLLEGDVGSGKTIVAAMAALQVIQTGWQVAFMAPTEILAQQHFQEITKILKSYNFPVGLLTGSEAKICLKNKIARIQPKEFLRQIKNGQIKIVIGTHALIQDRVRFKNLALVIVDEQHRFGVEQRAALQKNVSQMDDGSPTTFPHLLSMTATPIPRTLALTLYGDLDLSLLDEMPKGRQEIITRIVPPTSRAKAYDFIRQQIKKGRQAFVICPRIEISDKNLVISEQPEKNLITYHSSLITDVKAVKEEYEKLSKNIFPDLKLAMLHGKLKSKEKEKIMANFAAGQTDILVSTSVVEVGIDVPNASIMMIEGADRFGLAQLHQFRGRVGRGPHQSYCLLFTESSSKSTQARLKALTACRNGFELAEKDLQLRGPGEFFGTNQWGLPDLTMASLTDVELIKEARQEAIKILKTDYPLKNYPALCKKLANFQKLVHLE